MTFNVQDIKKSAQDGATQLGDKAKELDEKHHIQENAKELAQRGADKAKEVNEEYKLTEKAQEATDNAKNGLEARIDQAKEKIGMKQDS